MTGSSSKLPQPAEYALSLAEFNTNNALSLRQLRDEGAVRIMKFDDSILKGFREISQGVVAEMGSGDELSGKIYASYQEFRALISGWTEISEGAFSKLREYVPARRRKNVPRARW